MKKVIQLLNGKESDLSTILYMFKHSAEEFDSLRTCITVSRLLTLTTIRFRF